MGERKYKVNDNFFDVIDTQEKAYVLGLLFADGTVYKKANRLKLDLAESDIDILYKLKEVLNFEGDIHIYGDTKKFFSNEKEYKCQRLGRLLINSPQLTKRIIELGRGNVKNDSIFPTKIPKDLIRHFIRGYFDGDGHLSYWCDNSTTGHKKFSMGFCGTVNIVNSLSKILDSKFQCHSDIRSRHPDRDNNNVQSTFTGNRLCKRIMDWIYEDSTIYLKRKHDKYLELIDEVNRVSSNTKLYGSAYSRKQVIQLSTMTVFESVTKAAKSIGVSPSVITTKCKKSNDFMYYDEYLKNNKKVS